MNSRLLLTISVIVLCSGCSLFRSKPEPQAEPDTVTVVKWRTVNCGNPPERDHIDLRPMSDSWRILPGPDGEQRFTLSAEAYENLGFNITQILKGVKQLREEIKYYRDCIAEIPQED